MLTRCARIAPICLFALAVWVATVHAATPPRITDLGGVVGYSTTARGINDAGEIVGEQSRYVNESTSESDGLLWRKDAEGLFRTEKAWRAG